MWQGVAPLIPAIVIIGRELVVSGLREYLALVGQKLEVNPVGQVEDGTQFIALTVFWRWGMRIFPNHRVPVELIGLGFLVFGLAHLGYRL
ncbi:MAG: hypothetical protein CM1200mP4_1220 [Rhodospirillaceae bacterium]|nr:MAG: hypothetical protein CM1200mP4_1220 [Rhodospirillaceae bacterium]